MNWKTYAGQHALAEFVGMEHEGARMLVRQGYQDAARLLVERQGDSAAGTVGGGRERHPVVVLPTGETAVVRGYRRGGVLRYLNRRVYFAGNRAFDELRATEHAREGGVHVPRVVAAIESPAVIGYRALLVTLLIPGARDAADWLGVAEGEARRAMLHETGDQLARMHAAGVSHPDVNLRNLLVTDGAGGAPVVHVLDFDRSRVVDGPLPAADRAAAIRRLRRSARKLRAAMAPADWAALRAGYGDAWPPGVEPG
jgi:3-deoxy-D-manno-octulosonic acid kinase